MTAEIEGPFAPGGGIGADEPSVSLADHLDVSAPRCVWDLSRLRTDSSDDQVAIKQWGHGLFAFYSVTTLLLCGLATIGNRSEMNVGAAAPSNSIIASIDSK